MRAAVALMASIVSEMVAMPKQYDISHSKARRIRKPALQQGLLDAERVRAMRENDRRREALRAWMKAHKVSAPEIERRTGIPRTTLYSYLAGKSQSLAGAREARVAEKFSTTVQAIFSYGMRPSGVGVFGKIGARADVFPVADYEFEPMYEVDLPPTLDPEQAYVAFEVDGLSMPPAEPGWLAVFRRVQLPVEELLNTICMVDLDDGRRLFKRVRRGYTEGCFNLESWDGSPLIENVRIVTALPFAALTPGRGAR